MYAVLLFKTLMWLTNTINLDKLLKCLTYYKYNMLGLSIFGKKLFTVYFEMKKVLYVKAALGDY